jgi:hypothetical protein
MRFCSANVVLRKIESVPFPGFQNRKDFGILNLVGTAITSMLIYDLQEMEFIPMVSMSYPDWSLFGLAGRVGF